MTVMGHILGYPRVGLHRELKYALEKYWNQEISKDELLNVGYTLRMSHWKRQIHSGLDFLSVGDFAWYDHVLTMSAMVGNIPFRHVLPNEDRVTLDLLFRVARGYITDQNTMVVPSEMKKWFNTNYHYIVPEFVQDTEFKLNWMQLFDELDESLSLQHPVKPVIIGPISYLWLGKVQGQDFDRLSLLSSLLVVYNQILDKLSEKNIDWVQIDEPVLVLELPDQWKKAYLESYQILRRDKIKLLLTTYFDGISHQLDLINQLTVDGLHVDLVSNPDNISVLHKFLPSHWVLSAGVVNGRNIWKTDLNSWYCKLFPIMEQRPLWIGSSCSLLHSPIDLNLEINLTHQVRSWFAFALQKCSEIKILCDALNVKKQSNVFDQDTLKQYYCMNNNRSTFKLVHDFKVQERCNSIHNFYNSRDTSSSVRLELQKSRLNIPMYPTTTIGSFPQTSEIRELRLNFKNGDIDKNQYKSSIREYIKQIILEQEKLDLDVLVHGEPERNDMVEYFAEHLNGFVFTKNGWVQSYGSRCVKPPIIIGDISRPKPITTEWINYAQSLTKKPVKGILTGPITIMSWSFVREDLSRDMITLQLALSIRDEVMDLEKSGVSIIQVDEPALREGFPLKKSEQQQYLEWAINFFKVVISSVSKYTQIHTHICYSEFDEIMCTLFKLDVDVISIEASRSNLKFLEKIQKFSLDDISAIGPGVYDIHSKNEPKIIDIINKLNQYLKYVPHNRLWVNPDCGLKTRSWSEVKKSLKNMVSAAKQLRKL